MQIECFAQRLLNPFRGVVHTIRFESAEAVTTDGIEWDIYVANDAQIDRLGRAGKRALISDIRYGHWSAEKGLKRGPLYPSDDFRRLEEMGAVVYEHLPQGHSRCAVQIPRPFRALAARPQRPPLALLHSVRAQQKPTPGTARLARRHGRTGTVPQRGNRRLERAAAVYLTRYVNSLASGVAQWLRRTDDGAGLGLHTLKGGDELRGACWKPMPSRRCSSPPPAWMRHTPGWCTTTTPGRRRGCCCCRISTRHAQRFRSLRLPAGRADREAPGRIHHHRSSGTAGGTCGSGTGANATQSRARRGDADVRIELSVSG
jgi:hypothetical protein